jgi:hypothetical protein
MHRTAKDSTEEMKTYVHVVSVIRTHYSRFKLSEKIKVFIITNLVSQVLLEY